MCSKSLTSKSMTRHVIVIIRALKDIFVFLYGLLQNILSYLPFGNIVRTLSKQSSLFSEQRTCQLLYGCPTPAAESHAGVTSQISVPVQYVFRFTRSFSTNISWLLLIIVLYHLAVNDMNDYEFEIYQDYCDGCLIFDVDCRYHINFSFQKDPSQPSSVRWVTSCSCR